jgi:hypothetical protein
LDRRTAEDTKTLTGRCDVKFARASNSGQWIRSSDPDAGGRTVALFASGEAGESSSDQAKTAWIFAIDESGYLLKTDT